jgi:hypothetical protein
VASPSARTSAPHRPCPWSASPSALSIEASPLRLHPRSASASPSLAAARSEQSPPETRFLGTRTIRLLAPTNTTSTCTRTPVEAPYYHAVTSALASSSGRVCSAYVSAVRAGAVPSHSESRGHTKLTDSGSHTKRFWTKAVEVF